MDDQRGILAENFGKSLENVGEKIQDGTGSLLGEIHQLPRHNETEKEGIR